MFVCLFFSKIYRISVTSIDDLECNNYGYACIRISSDCAVITHVPSSFVYNHVIIVLSVLAAKSDGYFNLETVTNILRTLIFEVLLYT